MDAKKFYCFIVLLFVLPSAFTLSAQDSLNVTKISQLYSFWDDIEHIDCRDGLIYAADYSFGLRIIDVSDPDSMIEIGNCHLNGWTETVVVNGLHAYLSNTEYPYHRLKAVNISDPCNPVIAADISLEYDVCDLAVYHDYLYICGDNPVLPIYDLSFPVNPLFAAGIPMSGSPNSIIFNGDYAYVANDSGLTAVNIADPPNAQILNSLVTNVAVDLVQDGNYIYSVLPDPVECLVNVIDVSDPVNPLLVHNCSVSTYCLCIDINGDHAYIGGEDMTGSMLEGICIVDISNPLEAEEAGFYGISGGVEDIFAEAPCLYIPVGEEGVKQLNMNDPLVLVESGNISNPGSTLDVELLGNLAIVSAKNSIRIIDISDIYNPVETGSFQDIEYCSAIAVQDSLVFAADYQFGFKVIDLSNPYNPELLSEYDVLGNVFKDIEVQDDYLYLTAINGGLQIFNIADPAQPFRVGTYDAVIAQYVDIQGRYAYLSTASYNDLCILDISDPADPILVGTENGYHYYKLEVNGDYLYICAFSNDLVIIDVSNPTDPEEVNNYQNNGYTSDISIDGNWAVISSTETGLQVLDLSNPASPQETGHYFTPGICNSAMCIDDIAFVADAFHFGIYDISTALSASSPDISNLISSFQLKPLHPNPFNASTTIPFTLDRAGKVKIDIFDITGRSVGVQYIEPLHGMYSAGTHEVVWNAKGIASGVYLMRLSVDGGQQSAGTLLHETRKVILLK